MGGGGGCSVVAPQGCMSVTHPPPPPPTDFICRLYWLYIVIQKPLPLSCLLTACHHAVTTTAAMFTDCLSFCRNHYRRRDYKHQRGSRPGSGDVQNQLCARESAHVRHFPWLQSGTVPGQRALWSNSGDLWWQGGGIMNYAHQYTTNALNGQRKLPVFDPKPLLLHVCLLS